MRYIDIDHINIPTSKYYLRNVMLAIDLSTIKVSEGLSIGNYYHC